MLIYPEHVQMAESAGPPCLKKAKRSAPIRRVTPEERAKQFSDDLYADSGMLFCKFCDHCVDYIRVDTIKDHLRSLKHTSRKKSKLCKPGASGVDVATGCSSRQVTLTTIVKAKDAREDFILDYIKMCTIADIPLEKTEKIKPFLRKYCAQSGALMGVD